MLEFDDIDVFCDAMIVVVAGVEVTMAVSEADEELELVRVWLGADESLADVLRLSEVDGVDTVGRACLLYTSPSPRDGLLSRMPSSA